MDVKSKTQQLQDLNKRAVEAENAVQAAFQEEVEQRGLSKAFLAALIVVSIVTIVYGSVYIHESEAKVDDSVNWPLFWMAAALQQCIIGALMLATYRYASRQVPTGQSTLGDRRLEPGKYAFIVISLILCSYLVQAGVYNAIATPNVEHWNSIGLIFGSVLAGVGSLIMIAIIAYFVYRSGLKQKTKSVNEEKADA